MKLPYDITNNKFLYKERQVQKGLFTNNNLIRDPSFKYEHVLIEVSNHTNFFNEFNSRGILFFQDKKDIAGYKNFVDDYILSFQSQHEKTELLEITDSSNIDNLVSQFLLLKQNNKKITLSLSRNIYTRLVNHLSFNTNLLLDNQFYQKVFVTNDSSFTCSASDLLKFQKHITSFLVVDRFFNFDHFSYFNQDFIQKTTDLIRFVNHPKINTLVFSHPITSSDNYSSRFNPHNFSHQNVEDFLKVSNFNNKIVFKSLLKTFFSSSQKKEYADFFQSIIQEAPLFYDIKNNHKAMWDAVHELVSEKVILKGDLKNIKKHIFLQDLYVYEKENNLIEHFKTITESPEYSDKEISLHLLTYLKKIHKAKNVKNLKFSLNTFLNTVISLLSNSQLNELIALNDKQNNPIIGLDILCEKAKNTDTTNFTEHLKISSDIFLNPINQNIIVLDIDNYKLSQVFPTKFQNLTSFFFSIMAHQFNFTSSSISITNGPNASNKTDRFTFNLTSNEYNLQEQYFRNICIDFYEALTLEKLETADDVKSFTNNFIHNILLDKKLSLLPTNETPTSVKKKL